MYVPDSKKQLKTKRLSMYMKIQRKLFFELCSTKVSNLQERMTGAKLYHSTFNETNDICKNIVFLSLFIISK